jgi:hypothetical protein
MTNTNSKGTSDMRGARADETKDDETLAGPARIEDQQRRVRLLEFLAWRSSGVRFAISRAKRRARGRGPLKCIAAL